MNLSDIFSLLLVIGWFIAFMGGWLLGLLSLQF